MKEMYDLNELKQVMDYITEHKISPLTYLKIRKWGNRLSIETADDKKEGVSPIVLKAHYDMALRRMSLAASGVKLQRVISGGQTGADRGGLEAAIRTQVLDVGGFCPKGRIAEDGVIDEMYPLTETNSKSYPVRTKKNIQESDATVLFCPRSGITRGSQLTVSYCRELNRPFFIVFVNPVEDIENEEQLTSLSLPLAAWLIEKEIKVLNVAGTSESKCRGIEATTREVLLRTFKKMGIPVS